MIIKSLSRQNKSFGALYNYLTRDEDSRLRGFNLYSDPYNKRAVTKEFLENSRYLKRSRGKNYYYHEIISLSKNSLNQKEQEQILSDLTSKYISLRAENHLTFTALHTDKEHTHIHLMISANETMGTKRERLSKKDFSTIQKELETYVTEMYPELEQTKHYNKDLSKFKSKKEELISTLEELFKTSTSKDLFEKHCKESDLAFYVRGKTHGVLYEGKKYRLKTLGVLESYETCMKKQQHQENSQEQEQKKTAQSKENTDKIRAKRQAMKEQREARHEESREKTRDR